MVLGLGFGGRGRGSARKAGRRPLARPGAVIRAGLGPAGLATLLPGVALAHPGVAAGAPGWTGALAHVLSGPDHLVLMAVAGFAAARLGRRPGLALCAAAAGLAAAIHPEVAGAPAGLGAFLAGTAGVQAVGAGAALAVRRLVAAARAPRRS